MSGTGEAGEVCGTAPACAAARVLCRPVRVAIFCAGPPLGLRLCLRLPSDCHLYSPPLGDSGPTRTDAEARRAARARRAKRAAAPPRPSR